MNNEFFSRRRWMTCSRRANLNGTSLDQVMVEGGFIDEQGFGRIIATALGLDFVDLSEAEIPSSVLRLIPSGLARLHRALPVALSENTLHVALSDPFDLRAPEDLQFALGRNLRVVVAPSRQVEELIKRHYGAETPSLREVLDQLAEATDSLVLRESNESPAEIEANANATPILRYVDLILLEAIQKKGERHPLRTV